MKRKDFLHKGPLAAAALLAFGAVLPAREGGFAGDCETTNDILGPFYRPEAPDRNDLTWPTLVGTRITVKGTVSGPDCKTALPGAKVEIWHCDTQGEYDNASEFFRHRASQTCDEQGKYQFMTILPGKYLNGRLYRPSHIHFRISAPGHKELISQIYFDGDPHITEDPWASSAKAKHRILDLRPEGIHGELAVQFDVYLAEA